MEMNKPKADLAGQRNPRKQEGIDSWRAKKRNVTDGIENLPDDFLIAILSRMSVKDAVRTSILSTRWRYLWMFMFGKLEFDDRKFDGRNSVIIKRKKFKALVNHVLKLHRGPVVDSLIIHFTNLRSRVRSSDIDSWIYFAMHKEVKEFELNLSFQDAFHCPSEIWITLSNKQKEIREFELNLLEQEWFHCCYKFPNIDKLLSRTHEFKKSVFSSLRSLRLADVDIEDEVVHYFLASCPFIEQLCIRASNATKNLEVVHPLPQGN